MKKNTIFSMSGLCLLLTVVCTATAYGVGPYSSNGLTVLDNGTGLEWQQADDGQARDWSQALEYCEDLSLGGHDDWRLPNHRELDSIVDLTRYNPAINTDYFSCQVSLYWSATTATTSYTTNYAWSTHFSTGGAYSAAAKTDDNYVRCVRGGLSTGSFGQFGSFVFDPISSPVEPATCIPVRVEAHTAAGALDTGFNGHVSLNINNGDVSPTSLSFTNGVATHGCVKVYGQGENKQLQLSSLLKGGFSNYFSTTGAGTCTGTILIQAEIGVLGETVPNDTTIVLNRVNGGEYARMNTNWGLAIFSAVPCGSYIAYYERDGQTGSDHSPITINTNDDSYYSTLRLPKGSLTPVILIPGIMGSSHKGIRLMHPYLKGGYPDKELSIHFQNIATGWDDLEAALENAGYPVFDCPWDWRGVSGDDMNQIVDDFLKPCINEALGVSPNGKVHIIAHSMGGLLARTYIQSGDNASKVKKLALVAVPNRGSANPYFLWEGGDASTTKRILDDDFYEKTIRTMWKKTFHKNPFGEGKVTWKSCRAQEIKRFLHEKAPNIQLLMSTEPILKKNGPEYTITTEGNKNIGLQALNQGTHGFKAPGEVFSADNSKVQTRVFAGNIGDHSTLDSIDIGSPASNGLYADGQPLDAKTAGCKIRINGPATHFHDGKGDGTVPLTSAEYPATSGQGWATLIVKNNTKKHSKIINSFKDELVAFLNESSSGASPISKSLLLKKSAKLAETTTPKLSFSVIGSARFLVQESVELRISGIDPIANDLFDEIFESTHLEVNDAGMNLTLTCPDGSANGGSGDYTLTYFGPIERDFTLVISGYDSHGKVVEKEYHGFRPDHPQTLTISFDENMEELLDVQMPVKAPSEFETVPYSCATGKCAKLIWKPSESAGVSEYVIYRELADEPFYTELARVGAGATSYNTGEPWDSAGGYPVNGYAVSAIKADDTESFFAKEKNYVINKFPWPMFLPAVTGGR